MDPHLQQLFILARNALTNAELLAGVPNIVAMLQQLDRADRLHAQIREYVETRREQV